ncbi:MAG: uroporphyrinogen decarboxylase family protein [Spirochaetota bacterium]
MNKIERIDAVLSGREPDRTPISCWYHFGTQYLPGDKYAEIVLSFFKYFNFDWLKLMNDYYYPMPEGFNALKTASELKQLKPFEIEKSPWKEQLRAIEIIRKELDGQAYFCDTIFDPYQVLQRSPVGEHLPRLMKEEPDALLEALDVVSENITAYARRVLESGAHGVFVSMLSGKDQINQEDFLKFEKPFAMKVFQSVKDMGPMNTLHIHGHNIELGACLDFPVGILSWEDRIETNPSITEAKAKWNGCVMGGIDNTVMTRKTPEFLMNHVREGLTLGGKTRFLLANGCSLPGWMDPYSLKMMVKAAQTADNYQGG